MAKRKRASLKDKSPESLGLTQRKGKGIDLLFGGPSEQQESDAASQAASETEEQDEAGSSTEDTSTSASTAAQDVTAPDDERLVDELGLPVALEAPPEDLILASSSADVTSGEEDAVDPATSPFAMPVTEGAEAGTATGDPNDLSGILDEDSLPIVEDDNLSSSFEEKDQSGLVENSTPSGTASTGSVSDDDLSGLVGDASESDLAGLVIEEEPTGPEAGLTEDTAAAATDLSELASEAAAAPSTPTTPSTPPPASSPSSAPPPTTAAPINAPPSPAPEPAYQPSSAPATPTPEPAAPAYTQPAAAPAGPSAAPRPQEIGSIGGIVTEGTVSKEDILPEDALTETGDHIIPVEKRSQLEQDDALTEKVMRYIGRERRERLDQQIESLYNRVADELSDHRDDAAFALKTLSEAQDIIIEDPRQYDEALYRVAVVKTMLVRKQNLRRWSYTWGMFVFFYAILWLIAFVAGFFLDVGTMGGGQAVSEGAAAIRSAWISGLAGGIGGIVAILYSLSWRVAIKHEFDRQYIMKYLVQPFMGFLLGAVIFFITSAGFLILGGTSETTQFFGGDQLIFVQILLGFIAGFRQRVVYYMIDRIVQRISPKPTESKQPSSVVPSEDYYALQGEAEKATQ